MIGFLRKNFPSTVTSETVKKFSIAPNNESYVINALQFIGVINEEGKRTPKGHDVFVLGNDDFPKAFEGLVRESYSDLFDLRGDDAWALSKGELTTYFRTSDKTSDVIGSRQAGLFQVFARLAGHETGPTNDGAGTTPKAKAGKPKAVAQKLAKDAKIVISDSSKDQRAGKEKDGRRDMALTVRIEINLPANGSQETYDNIFKSIRANLIDE
jgi:hypothetical protein